MMYDELIKRLRAGAISANSGNEISESLYSDIMQAADVIEELICEVADEHNARLDAADAIEELNRRIDRAIELYNRNVEKSAMYEALAGISPEPPKEG